MNSLTNGTCMTCVGFKQIAGNLRKLDKILSDRQTGGEGPVSVAVCDAFFQLHLRVRLQTITDTQYQNVMQRFGSWSIGCL